VDKCSEHLSPLSLSCDQKLKVNSLLGLFLIVMARLTDAGRSGRAGRSGQAITLYTEEDVPLLHSTAHIIQASGCEVPGWMLSLPKGPKRKAPTSREAISTRPPLEAKVLKRKSNKPLKVEPVPDAKGTNENQLKYKKSRKGQHISYEGVLT
jgi:superfamily II DNA/RNA helicase